MMCKFSRRKPKMLNGDTRPARGLLFIIFAVQSERNGARERNEPRLQGVKHKHALGSLRNAAMKSGMGFLQRKPTVLRARKER